MHSLKSIFLKESAGRPAHEIRFVGNYDDLEAMGFEIVGMYAREYRTYIKDDVYIFQEREGEDGEKEEHGDVDISDWYENSYLVLQTLIDNDFKLGKFNQVMLDKDTMTISTDYQENAKKEMDLMTDKETSEEELNKKWKEHYRRYKKENLSDKMIETLRELYSKGMIEIQ